MSVNGTLKNPKIFKEENVAGLLAVPTTHEHLCHHQLGSQSEFLSGTRGSCQILTREQSGRLVLEHGIPDKAIRR